MFYIVERVLLGIGRSICEYIFILVFVCLVKVFSLLQLSGDLKQLLRGFSNLDIYLEVSDLLAYFEELNYVGSVPLDSFDSHIIVHTLLHKSSICECFGII